MGALVSLGYDGKENMFYFFSLNLIHFYDIYAHLMRENIYQQQFDEFNSGIGFSRLRTEDIST